MPDIQTIPHINAALNGLSIVCLMIGYIFIKSGNKAAHRAAMMGAIAVSALFLVFYLYYKANSGFAKFGGEGFVRPVYFTILIAHIIGAAAIVPLVPMAIVPALRGNFDRHRKIVRWTWPLWMYVGVSGIVVYAMAIWLFPFTG